MRNIVITQTTVLRGFLFNALCIVLIIGFEIFTGYLIYGFQCILILIVQ